MASTNVRNPSQISSPRQIDKLAQRLGHTLGAGRRLSTRYAWCKLLILGLFVLSTASFNRPIMATDAPCHSLLLNGDLEETTNWQTKNSDGLPLFSTQVAHTGHQSAYLGGRHNAADRLSTTVQLPADSNALTLQFWWQIQSQETVTGNDRLEILIGDGASSNLSAPLFALHGRDAAAEWQSVTIDLSRFAGKAIELQFLSLTDAEQVTDFFIDDIDVLACAGSTT